MQDIPLTTQPNKSVIGPETTINISGLLHRGDSKSVCAMVEDKEKSIEIRLPEGEILFCKGYTPSEQEEILAYLNENLGDIMNTAKEINPMKAFMG